MAYEDKEFLLDRETLQELAPPGTSREEEALVILQKIKRKEIKATLRDENFAMVTVRGVITDKASRAAKLWIEDWKGFKLPKPWALKVLELPRPILGSWPLKTALCKVYKVKEY